MMLPAQKDFIDNFSKGLLYQIVPNKSWANVCYTYRINNKLTGGCYKIALNDELSDELKEWLKYKEFCHIYLGHYAKKQTLDYRFTAPKIKAVYERLKPLFDQPVDDVANMYQIFEDHIFKMIREWECLSKFFTLDERDYFDSLFPEECSTDGTPVTHTMPQDYGYPAGLTANEYLLLILKDPEQWFYNYVMPNFGGNNNQKQNQNGNQGGCNTNQQKSGGSSNQDEADLNHNKDDDAEKPEDRSQPQQNQNSQNQNGQNSQNQSSQNQSGQNSQSQNGQGQDSQNQSSQSDDDGSSSKQGSDQQNQDAANNTQQQEWKDGKNNNSQGSGKDSNSSEENSQNSQNKNNNSGKSSSGRDSVDDKSTENNGGVSGSDSGSSKEDTNEESKGASGSSSEDAPSEESLEDNQNGSGSDNSDDKQEDNENVSGNSGNSDETSDKENGEESGEGEEGNQSSGESDDNSGELSSGGQDGEAAEEAGEDDSETSESKEELDPEALKEAIEKLVKKMVSDYQKLQEQKAEAEAAQADEESFCYSAGDGSAGSAKVLTDGCTNWTDFEGLEKAVKELLINRTVTTTKRDLLYNYNRGRGCSNVLNPRYRTRTSYREEAMTVLLDVSGSISESNILGFVNIFKNVSATIGKKCTIVLWDTCLRAVYDSKDENIRAISGGCTDIGAGIDWIRDNMQPKDIGNLFVVSDCEDELQKWSLEGFDTSYLVCWSSWNSIRRWTGPFFNDFVEQFEKILIKDN